jgi:hypothetical protein
MNPIETVLTKTGLKWVGKKTDSYKTVAGGICYALGMLTAAVQSLFMFIYPDLAMQTVEPAKTIEGLLTQGGEVLIGIGVAHKGWKAARKVKGG